MTTNSAIFRMADRLTGGTLAAELRRRRLEGQSQEQMARELYAEFGIEVSRPTVATWLKDIEKED